MTSGIYDLDLDDLTLLAAGTGPDVSGWFFAVNDPLAATPSVEQLDDLNSSGIVTVGDELYRVLSSPSKSDASGDLLAYDRTGIVRYRRVDGLADSHGLIWDGTHLVVPCSAANKIVWLDRGGNVVREWAAPGRGDAWHVNGVHVRGGRLCASAFGQFAEDRGWSASMGERCGRIFDVETQATIVSDLACPHDPLFLDGGWMVCDSFTNRFLHIDERTGELRRSVDLGGWTRGVAVSHRHIFVGLSGQRYGHAGRQNATIVILNRSTWQVVGEIPLPCQEITAMQLAPRTLLAGLRRGFRTNELRTAVDDHRDFLQRVGNVEKMIAVTPMRALDRDDDFQVRVRARAVASVQAGRYFDIAIELENGGQQTLFSGPPHPVNVGMRFMPLGDAQSEIEERRSPLPEPVPPGATIRFTFPVTSPRLPGTYNIALSLVQEWVRWFDCDDATRGQILTLTVVPSDGSVVHGSVPVPECQPADQRPYAGAVGD